jgi:hypothetical protein
MRASTALWLAPANSRLQPTAAVAIMSPPRLKQNVDMTSVVK